MQKPELTSNYQPAYQTSSAHQPQERKLELMMKQFLKGRVECNELSKKINEIYNKVNEVHNKVNERLASQVKSLARSSEYSKPPHISRDRWTLHTSALPKF